MAAQAFLIGKYWAFTDAFNKSSAPLWFKQLFIYIGKLFPSSSVDAYYLAYAVPGQPPSVPIQQPAWLPSGTSRMAHQFHQ